VEKCTLYLNAEAEVLTAQAAIKQLTAAVQGADLSESNAQAARLTEDFRKIENQSSALSGGLAGLAKVWVLPDLEILYLESTVAHLE
jgi:hypothetical protein